MSCSFALWLWLTALFPHMLLEEKNTLISIYLCYLVNMFFIVFFVLSKLSSMLWKKQVIDLKNVIKQKAVTSVQNKMRRIIQIPFGQWLKC